MRTLSIFLWLLLPLFGFSQENAGILSPQQFLEIVRQNHPLSKIARLQPAKAEAELLKARGAFDPKLGAGMEQKYFDGKKYFSLADVGIKAQTWAGLELKAGYSHTQGVYLNPENTQPEDGLLYGGISLPLGQGLIIDQRRAVLKQAKVARELSLAERDLMLNQLIFEAAYAYWNWFTAYHELNIRRDALQLAEDRLKAVKEYARLGDRPMVDTLEARIQWQNRQIALQDAELQYQQSQFMLENLLWINEAPLALEEDTRPPDRETIEAIQPDPVVLLPGMDSLRNGHPMLRAAALQIDQMEIERRWKKEQLKPQLNLSYQPLLFVPSGERDFVYNPANYKWGVQFNMPLLLRKERGALALADIKIRESDFKLDNKTREIYTKSQAARSELNILSSQWELYRQNQRDYARLLNAERALFQQGESSLFMINSRETKWLDARIKELETLGKIQKAEAKLKYILGAF
ncbi:MAG: TolC family protein [Bacteroidetes bacterium]|nr:TolC family protein [Bacteroidota bacterium]